MKGWRLLLRSLRYHWRVHLGVGLGAFVCAAVLSGALVLGDSVDGTLNDHARERIGPTGAVLLGTERMCRDGIVDRIDAGAVAMLQLRASATNPSTQALASDVRVIGVDGEAYFSWFGGTAGEDLELPHIPSEGEALITAALAERLGFEGDTGDIVVRIEEWSALPRSAALGIVEAPTRAIRLKATVVDQPGMDLDLTVNQRPPLNCIVDLDWLQTEMELDDRVSLVLLDEALPMKGMFLLEDLQLEIDGDGEEAILRSERLFIDPEVEASCGTAGTGVLTYFVNTIECGDLSTPYSMVTGIGPLQGGPGPFDLEGDEIAINDWLAEDLECEVGDPVSLTYFVIDDEDRLVERTATFTVARVVPMTGLAADPSLMPDFPGIADAESNLDWDPGIPIDLGRIRTRDEDYWDAHRGTPKAFVPLETARGLWSNDFGALTEVRFDAADAETIRTTIESLDPATLGFEMRSVGDTRVASTDFGGLFLGLSIFIVIAALTLASMLFVFGIEVRSREVGVLESMGFTRGRIRRLVGGEGVLIASAGSVAGALAGVAYASGVLQALSGIWSGAVASSAITLHVRPTTIGIAAMISAIVCSASILLAMSGLLRTEVLDLLRGHTRPRRNRGTTRVSAIVAIMSFAGAGGLLATMDSVGAYFGGGSLLLIGGVAVARVLLRRVPRSSRLTFAGLAKRHTTRNPGRSLATIVVLASGAFLVVSVSANQLGVSPQGAGRFDLFVTTSVPVDGDLAHDDDMRDDLTLDLRDATVVSMRVREGDDASCLNLSVASQPTVFGADPDALDGRFEFVQQIDASESAWALLRTPLPDGAIPAIVDDASAKWTMKKALGEGYTFLDEHGESFDIVIVGTIANSILQGTLIIDRDRFERRFPSRHGFGAFMIETDDMEPTSRDLRFALADHGVEVQDAMDRLRAFNAVQNTYLSIFRALGGIGLLIGTIGLGIVVARNVLERRHALTQLGVLGFPLVQVRRLVLIEHALLLVAGVGIGLVAAVVSVLPVLDSIPVAMLAGLVLAIIVNGAFWIWLATILTVPRAGLVRIEDA